MSILGKSGLLSAAFLAGCVGSGGPIGGALAGLGGSSARPVLQGALHVDAPSGYCVDPETLHEAEDRAVVLMGRCPDRSAVKPALVSLVIGPDGSAGVMVGGGAELSDFFTSSEGRATLASSGDPEDVQVIEALTAGDAFLMRVQDAGEPEYWRAVTGLNGRLATLSVKGGAEVPLAEGDSRQILDRALVALRRANRG